jgi:Ca-activated chloride channel homolog
LGSDASLRTAASGVLRAAAGYGDRDAGEASTSRRFQMRFRLFSRSVVMRFQIMAMFVSASLIAASPESTQAKQIHLDVALAYPTMLIEEDSKGQNHLRIALTGFDLPTTKQRMPINVAIVIDKSGSMQGDKIVQARKAAIQAVERLRASDIVSIVTYDSSVSVVVPATKASDLEMIKDKIGRIEAGGNTALFAGVSKGAAELRKFLDDKRVNRVILLSDGLANVGPSSPSDLEQLGESLIKEGISVSTMGLGLGYNEDLMSRLALASSGNHVFIEDAENLVQVFQNEFDDVLSVVAQKIQIEAKLADGIRPVKVLNYPANIIGQTVAIDLGQLYSRQERYFVLEVEIPFGKNNTTRPVAEVAVTYMNMLTETTDKLTSSVRVRFTNDRELVKKDVDKETLAACILQCANESNYEATRLRDAGKVEEARQLLNRNADFLDRYHRDYGLEELKKRSELNRAQSMGLEAKDWAATRKGMVENYYGELSQQRYSGSGAKTEGQKP